MRIPKHFFYLLLACLVGVFLTACDMSEQHIDFESGSSLTISGPSELIVPNYDSTGTAEYMVQAFTVEKEYNWSVEGGASLQGTRRDGEVAIAASSDPGVAYDISVTTTVDGEEYSGVVSGDTTRYPTIGEQTQRYNNLSTFGTGLSDAGLTAPMMTNQAFADGWTAFVPSNDAFLEAFDADDSGGFNDGELPVAGVFEKVLQYHVVTDSLTAGDISGQSPSTWHHADETLSLSSGDPVTVGATNVTANVDIADIATGQGVVHKIDEVLLPAGIVSFNEQTAIRGGATDTVVVEGAYMEDGGFMVVHDSTSLADDGGLLSVVGNSDFLEAGFHGTIKVALDNELTQDTTLTAMPHRDTDGDETYDFEDTGGVQDGPYTRGSTSDAVIEHARVLEP